MNLGDTVVLPNDTLNAAARRRMLSRRGEPLLIAAWERALMIHFEVDAEALQHDVAYELDLRDGRAFVSLVAFTMRGMKPRIGGRIAEWLFRPIATHGFLNVRTYVRHNGEPGIHFLAEWLSNRFAVLLGPTTFGLPYRHGRIAYQHDWQRGDLRGRVVDVQSGATFEYCAGLGRLSQNSRATMPSPSLPSDGGEGRGEEVRFCSEFPSPRSSPHSFFMGRGRSHQVLRRSSESRASFEFAPCEAGSLDEWLMERYTAFNSTGSRKRFFRVWHPPWAQCPANVELSDISLLTKNWCWFAAAQYVGANFSPGFCEVWMGRPHRIKSR